MKKDRKLKLWVVYCWKNNRSVPREMVFLLSVLVKRWVLGDCWKRRNLTVREGKGRTKKGRLVAALVAVLGAWCILIRCTLPLTNNSFINFGDHDLSMLLYLYLASKSQMHSLLSEFFYFLDLSEFSKCPRIEVNTGIQYFHFCSVMAKDKEKLPFNEILCTPASQATKIVKLGSPKVTPIASSSVNDGKVINKPMARLPNEKGKGKLSVDSKSLFEKLAFARAKAKKTKDLTLMACLIGKFLEFPKIFTKLRMEWRVIKGEVQFYDQKNGWFEIVFSNPLDLTKIWDNRPYHVGGQLLLIKPWSLDFDPLSEPISVLDLWIRIFKLPNEYKSAEALSAILEANGFGKFIRLDLIHLKRKWVKFVRICVNTDVEITTGQKIIIPDENMIEHKYNVWFDDFPVGCGNCGEINHVFNDCPEKAPIPPSITIALKKPSSKGDNQDMSKGWTKVGNVKGQSSKGVSNPHGHRPYLAENAGIDVVYESEDSGELKTSDLNVENAILANDLHVDTQGTERLSTENGLGKETDKDTMVKNMIHQATLTGTEDKSLPTDDSTLIPPQETDVYEGEQQSHSPDIDNHVPNCPELLFEEADIGNNIPLFEDEEEDPSEVEEDDPEELLNGNKLMIDEDQQFVDFIINTEIPFKAEDLEAYLNEPDEEMMVTYESGNSFHSTRNSMFSSSSMADKMDGLAMNVGQGSKSNSSKRKTNYGDEDTASSQMKGAKKQRT